MGGPMKKRNLVRTIPSGLVMFILMNTMVGQAAADELSSAAESAIADDEAASVAVQSLQQSFAQQRELIAMQSEQLERQNQQIREQSERLQNLENQLKQLALAHNGANMSPTEQQAQIMAADSAGRQPSLAASSQNSEMVTQEMEAAKQLRDPEIPIEVATHELPGFVQIPGTDASMKLGGYAKMSIVQSFDPVGSTDRFAPGTIPVPAAQDDLDDQANLTTRQSRLNLDMRRYSTLGPLRAFIEGDFAGEGDTLRLRHAYGQLGKILAGQTWSTMVDIQANPEEIDFEGLNGRVNVRQPQLRFFPSFGENLELSIAVEDPNPDVTGGTGLTEVPDVVAAIRFSSWNRLHIKAALLLRQIRAEPDNNPGTSAKEEGWGLSVSGHVNLPFWGERDEFMYQLNYGDGIGRYINDLGTVGGQDAVFNPATGELKTLTAFGGYLAYQHWWSEKMRSTLVAGYTDVDNLDFQPDDAYRQTKRVTANLLFSPIPRVDIGAEFLWGERTNKNGDNADALQLQIAAKYIF
jgi:hypothetical protein